MLRKIKNYLEKFVERYVFGYQRRFVDLTEFSSEGPVVLIEEVYVGKDASGMQILSPLPREKSFRIRNHPLYKKRQEEKNKKLEESLRDLLPFAEKVHALRGTDFSAPRESTLN